MSGTLRRRRSASCLAPVLEAVSIMAKEPNGFELKEGVDGWNEDGGRLVDGGRRSEVDRFSRYQRGRIRNESRGLATRLSKDHSDPKGRKEHTANFAGSKN